MSNAPETQEAVERWRQGKINIFDEMARLERERNEARRDVLKMSTLATEYADAASKWQQCAKRLAVSIAWSLLVPTKSMEAALAEFERLKGEAK